MNSIYQIDSISELHQVFNAGKTTSSIDYSDAAMARNGLAG
ncbi:MAG: hypothetical protein AAF149_20755 [Bacteroidota bacterium]